MAGRISQLLSALRAGLISDVPPEYQACESCREPFCNSAKAENCLDRRYGEEQERSRRLSDPGRSGTHVIGLGDRASFDVPVSQLAGAPPKSTVRTRLGDFTEVTEPERRSTKVG
ncbi:MAG TPA: hypothetical protein VKP30_28965 [Polyangiaceae bacterium]|nr:hypothetical protein [Polyangiaceae bacterium]